MIKPKKHGEPLKNKLRMDKKSEIIFFSEEDVASAVEYLKEQLREFKERCREECRHKNNLDYCPSCRSYTTIGIIEEIVDTAFPDAVKKEKKE